MQVSVTRAKALASAPHPATPGPATTPGPEVVSLPEGASTADLLAACGLDPRRCVAVVNGVAVPRAVALAEGDRVQLYPNQAGG